MLRIPLLYPCLWVNDIWANFILPVVLNPAPSRMLVTSYCVYDFSLAKDNLFKSRKKHFLHLFLNLQYPIDLNTSNALYTADFNVLYLSVPNLKENLIPRKAEITFLLPFIPFSADSCNKCNNKHANLNVLSLIFTRTTYIFPF